MATKIRKRAQDDSNQVDAISLRQRFVTWKNEKLGPKGKLVISLVVLVVLASILLFTPGINLYDRMMGNPIDGENLGPEHSLRPSDNQPWVVNKVIDIKSIAGKSEEVVKATLGEPQRREEGIFNYSDGKKVEKNSPVYTYPNGLRIQFIEAKAARIFVKPEKPMLFSTGYPRALGVVGLDPNIQPTLKENNVIRWNNVEGLYEIAAKREDRMVGSVQVTIDEKYK